MISRKDIKLMPITFIVAPILLGFLVFVAISTYDDMLKEKELITSLSCPELRDYAENQVLESKLYFGHEVYLSYAEKLYSDHC